MRLGTQTIVRKGRPGESTSEDEYGNPIPGAPGPDLTITGCSVQPGAGPEFIDRRDAVEIQLTAYCPLADVNELDQIEYAGTVYEVSGQIARWEVGTRLDHMALPLKVVTG